MNPALRRVLLAACGALSLHGHLHAGLVPGSKNLGAIWFIGDSITQSNADGDSNGSPRKSLYDLLVANGYTFSYTGHWTQNTDGLPTTGALPETNLYQYHSGISGSVIDSDYSGRTGMTQNTPSFWTSGRLATVKPNVILIMLGTNDIDINLDIANAPARLSTLVDTIHAQPGVGNPTVFLATIPPNRTSLPADPVNTAAYNAVIPDVVATQRGLGRDVRFVDQFTPIDDNYAANMQGDNLHPNATGNNTMAQQWYNAIAAVVNEPPADPNIVKTGASASKDTDNTPAAGYATAATFAADIRDDDLINAGQPSLVSVIWDKPPAFQFGTLNDGRGHTTSTAAGMGFPATSANGIQLPYTCTFTLNTTVNTLGYNISAIRTFAGWNQNGSSLANQRIEVQVSTVRNPTFKSLGIFQFTPFLNSSTAEAAASKMTLTPRQGFIASRVDAIRFVIHDPGFNSNDSGPSSVDGSVFQEIDVIGQAIPVGLDAWAASSGIPPDPANDDDHDGIPALVEYALGLNPKEPSILPALETAGSWRRITWRKGGMAAVDTRLHYTVQTSPDLTHWSPVDPAVLSQTTGRITFTLPNGQARLFTRLQITQTEP